MPCEHVSNGFPEYREVPGQSFWKKKFKGTNVTLHWFCWKCGVELEPVYREKAK